MQILKNELSKLKEEDKNILKQQLWSLEDRLTNFEKNKRKNSEDRKKMENLFIEKMKKIWMEYDDETNYPITIQQTFKTEKHLDDKMKKLERQRTEEIEKIMRKFRISENNF